MRLNEKICKGERANYKRYLKRGTARMMRREARRDPENAPRKRVYYGWSS